MEVLPPEIRAVVLQRLAEVDPSPDYLTVNREWFGELSRYYFNDLERCLSVIKHHYNNHSTTQEMKRVNEAYLSHVLAADMTLNIMDDDRRELLVWAARAGCRFPNLSSVKLSTRVMCMQNTILDFIWATVSTLRLRFMDLYHSPVYIRGKFPKLQTVHLMVLLSGATAGYLPNLAELPISSTRLIGSRLVDNEQLAEDLDRFDQMTELDMETSKSALMRLMSRSPDFLSRLRFLTLRSLESLDCIDLISMVSQTPNLESLVLECSTNRVEIDKLVGLPWSSDSLRSITVGSIQPSSSVSSRYYYTLLKKTLPKLTRFSLVDYRELQTDEF